jgi:hypothetical protein
MPRRHDAIRHPGLPHATRRPGCRDPAHSGRGRQDPPEDCRVGTDIPHGEQIRAEFDAVFLGLGAQAGRALPIAGQVRRLRTCVTATVLPEGLQRRAPAAMWASAWWWSAAATRRSTWPRWRGAWATSTRSTPSRPLPEHAIAGHVAHDVATRLPPRQGAEVTLTSVFAISTRCRPPGTRWNTPCRRASPSAAAWRRSAVIRGEDGRAIALRIVRMRGQDRRRTLDIKTIEGTEEDIPADLIVSAIGQAVDFTGLTSSTTARARSTATRTTRCRGSPASSSAATWCGRIC